MEQKQSLGLIDLISEKHLELRARLHESDGQAINKTEAHILAVLRKHGKLTVSEIGRIIHISRQGTHKCIQGMLEAELVETDRNGGTVRDKPLVLTDKGRECFEQLESTKERLERVIAERLGQESVDALKRLLQEDWFPAEDEEDT